jgi:parvulin-like peptidyl-prolyl isomerase
MGYKAMNRHVTFGLVILLGIVLFGCQSGKQAVPVAEAPAADSVAAEEPKKFVFAETPFLIIDSEMMAEQFQLNQIPAAIKTIDSAAALDAVYQMLLDSLLGEESREFDLTTDPDLYRQYLQRRRGKVLRQMYIDVIYNTVTVPESTVVTSYEVVKEEYKLPDQYRAHHVVIAGHVLRDEDSALYPGKTDEQMDSIAYEIIVDLRRQLLKGASFDTLAMMYSHDPHTKAKGGDLGYFQLESMVYPFDSAVEHTPIGEISGIIKTMYGWHVIRVDDYSPEHYQPLDSVFGQVESKLRDKALMESSRAFVDSVAEEGVIAIDTAVLMMDDSLHTRYTPMAYVNPDDKEFGNDTLYYQDYAEQVYPYKRMKGLSRPLNLDEKTDLITNIAVRFHMLRASRKLGFYNSNDVEEWAAQLIKKYSVAILRKRLIEDGYEPADEEIETYYDAHIDEYISDRPVYVQHIIFADSSLAEHMRDVLMSGADFLETADQYYPGDPDIRRAAADLGYIGEYDMPEPFWRAAMSTPVGRISSPVKTEFGYHLIKVIRKAFPTTLEKARSGIKALLIKKHKEKIRKEYVEDGLGGSPKIYWERLGDLYRKELPPLRFVQER